MPDAPLTLTLSPDQVQALREAWHRFPTGGALETAAEGPVTIAELARRGLDPRLEEVLNIAIGDVLRSPPGNPITPEEMAALGYGPVCECGERGLGQGEKACAECPDADDAAELESV